MRGVLIVVAAGLLTACSSTRYIQIETYNPGEVTFPEHVGQVLIVNNAVPQPKDTGYTYELFGEAQDACEIKADSALFVACVRSVRHGRRVRFVDVPDPVNGTFHSSTMDENDKVVRPERNAPHRTAFRALISLDGILFTRTNGRIRPFQSLSGLPRALRYFRCIRFQGSPKNLSFSSFSSATLRNDPVENVWIIL